MPPVIHSGILDNINILHWYAYLYTLSLKFHLNFTQISYLYMWYFSSLRVFHFIIIVCSRSVSTCLEYFHSQSLLNKARTASSVSSSRRVALFRNVDSTGKSGPDSRRSQTPLVNINPFTPEALLIQSTTQQKNNRKRAHWNEYVTHLSCLYFSQIS